MRGCCRRTRRHDRLLDHFFRRVNERLQRRETGPPWELLERHPRVAAADLEQAQGLVRRGQQPSGACRSAVCTISSFASTGTLHELHHPESRIAARERAWAHGRRRGGSIRALVIALVARGHVLVQGVPGLGKTLLAKTLARALGGEFKRIQATPDLMPSDIIGVHVFDESQRDFVFRQGPLFADVVLVDEINRTGPKTQSALLEAMEERQVSVDRSVFALPADFLVLATQNPREFEGTYPLPESQLDRFMLRIDIDYPSREAEAEILNRYGARLSPSAAEDIGLVDPALLQSARQEAEQIHVSEALTGYVLDLARASREHPRLSLGLSTRGALALIKAARIAAGLRGADFVSPDDVKEVAVGVMAHRLALAPEAALEGGTDVEIVRALLADTPVPQVTMHLAERGYALIVLTALLAIAGTWSSEPALEGAWHWAALLLLTGLAVEGHFLSRTHIQTDIETAPRARLGREQPGAFAFRNDSSRDLEIEYAPLVPAGFEPFDVARRVTAPRRGVGRDAFALLPIRLGPQSWPAVPARVLGRLGLAWWPRTFAVSRDISVAPDTLRAPRRRPSGAPTGMRPRRVVGAGSELHQLRTYVRGDPLARIDWKASARTRRLITREFIGRPASRHSRRDRRGAIQPSAGGTARSLWAVREHCRTPRRSGHAE